MKTIETHDLGKVYENGVLALRDLSLSVKRARSSGFSARTVPASRPRSGC